MKLLLLTMKFKNSDLKIQLQYKCKTQRKKQYSFLIFLFPILLVSCIEKELDFDQISGKRWAAHWAVPLVNSSLTIDDF